MKNLFKTFLVLLNIVALSQCMAFAQIDKIKFDKQTYLLSNPESKTKSYDYLLKDDNAGSWHTKIQLSNFPDLTNPTDASAQYAHEIQEKTKGASVLLYPDAAIVGFLTYPATKEYYEYNTALYQPAKTKGLDRFSYAKRFYASELGGAEEARKKAIDFAEKNNKKYMEMVSKEASKYKVD